jgi:hypothetical protein
LHQAIIESQVARMSAKGHPGQGVARFTEGPGSRLQREPGYVWHKPSRAEHS